eukprot:TRINITY_DN2600_c0_g2_i4.p1 TRINITY_DN2600_c0_g2~~TRINITY_DN2600_c0_g2_i4.p1  ORF type:complete len:255 (-),score=63.09 TRINITY_DN2600_c0_g2_i4:177-941(-)
MQLSEFLAELQKTADEDTQNQLQRIIERIYKEPVIEEVQRELSDAEADEEYDSIGEIEPDEDIAAHRILTGEALLQSEFGLLKGEAEIKCNVTYVGKSKSREEDSLDYREPKVEVKPAKDEEKYIEEVKVDEVESERSETPVILEKEVDEERVPTAMQPRPRIPRTPIPEDRLKQVQRENEKLKKNAMHVYVNEEANVKKQKMILESARGEERKNFAEDHKAGQNVYRSPKKSARPTKLPQLAEHKPHKKEPKK